MVDPDEFEILAVRHGGQMGGEMLESIGKTDLAQMTPEEWEEFLLCVVGGYHDRILQLQYEGQKR